MLKLKMAIAASMVAFAAVSSDVEWKWDESGRPEDEPPTVQTVTVSVFDSRLYAWCRADPIADGLRIFDTRTSSCAVGAGTNFSSKTSGLVIVFK